MCRRTSHTCGLLALATALLTISAPATFGDELAAYLEDRGLTRLRAVYLEEQLAAATGQEREAILLQLASVYARLLETTDDPNRRDDLEDRSRELLGKSPRHSADELRLALLRGSYRSAELIAEKHRLRLSSEQELQEAAELLQAVIPDLSVLRTQLTDQMDLLERRLSRSGGAQAAEISEEIERAGKLHTQCTFLNAWALYYSSFLHERKDNARIAQPLFAGLMGAESAYPVPEEISRDLRATESFARSILGMAMCLSITASSPTALHWLDLLDEDYAFAPLRQELPAWRMAIHLEKEEFIDAREVLEGVIAADEKQAVPPTWLRLAAVHALEAAGGSRSADELLRLAVTELATRGELRQILDLASRYGVQRLGGSGFVLRYVGGVLEYDRARAAHGSEAPSTEPELTARYDQAVSHFNDALQEPDASDYPSAAAACRRLIAWCRYFQSRFLEAREAFEAAAAHLPGDDAPDALWMAIVSLDRAAEAGQDKAIREELSRLIELFLEQYPGSEHAPMLVYRRAQETDEASLETVAELLAILPDSEVYSAAQSRAAQMLYRLFRNAKGDERLTLGSEYLSVAVGLLAADEARFGTEDPLVAHRYLARCRRVLEVALTAGIDRLVAAANALRAYDELAAAGVMDVAAYSEEIDYRRAQERLGWDDRESASAIADAMWNRNPDSVWTHLAQRAVFKHARARWKDRDSEMLDNREALSLVIRFGQRVLKELEDDGDSLGDPAVLMYYATVAEAAMARWERSRSEADGRLARSLFQKLIEVRPRNGRFLRSLAVLAESFGETERSLEYWRRLVVGRAIGSDEWYEAKFHLLELLLQTDARRAREVMDQHKQLTGEYGPPPWGARLRGLDERIDRRLATEPSPEGGTGP